MGHDSTRREYIIGTGALVVGSSLAGCSGNGGNGDGDDAPADGGSGGTTIDMTDELVFEPEEMTVSVGDTVVWDNVGSVGHSVTAYEDSIPDGAEYFASGGFDSEQTALDEYAPGDEDSGDIPGGETWEHTFETAGTYEYYCIPHESAGMVGTVVVES